MSRIYRRLLIISGSLVILYYVSTIIVPSGSTPQLTELLASDPINAALPPPPSSSLPVSWLEPKVDGRVHVDVRAATVASAGHPIRSVAHAYRYQRQAYSRSDVTRQRDSLTLPFPLRRHLMAEAKASWNAKVARLVEHLNQLTLSLLISRNEAIDWVTPQLIPC